MILCMTELGLRISEVAHLSLPDLDWRKGTLRLIKSEPSVNLRTRENPREYHQRGRFSGQSMAIVGGRPTGSWDAGGGAMPFRPNR